MWSTESEALVQREKLFGQYHSQLQDGRLTLQKLQKVFELQSLFTYYKIRQELWFTESEALATRKHQCEMHRFDMQDAYNRLKFLAHLAQQDGKIAIAEIAARQRHEGEQEGIRAALCVTELNTRKELMRSDGEMHRARENVIQQEELLRFKDIERREVELRRTLREMFVVNTRILNKLRYPLCIQQLN